MAASTTSTTPLPFPLSLCNRPFPSLPKPSLSLSHHHHHHHHLQLKSLKISPTSLQSRRRIITPSSATRKTSNNSRKRSQILAEEDEDDTFRRKLTRSVLWVMEGVYILWLFFLPFAPGDPVWAISSDTINSLVGLSLNFFFILPIINFEIDVIALRDEAVTDLQIYGLSSAFMPSANPVRYQCSRTNHLHTSDRVAGIHIMEAPVLHPMSEGLFNFVVGWTIMFAPLLYTDIKNGRYKGSLDVLWGLQMFLTNTFLIPYMAIRLNEADPIDNQKKPSQLGTVMIKGAPIVGLVGGAVCAISFPWALYGRMDGNFGSVIDRWNFLLSYLGSERLAYAFVWDIVLYTIFQPWLIGENLENVAENRIVFVNYVRYIPVVGLLAYLLF